MCWASALGGDSSRLGACGSAGRRMDMQRRLDAQSAQHCRDQAERLRSLAAKCTSPMVQQEYQQLAVEWDMMAEQIEMLLRR